MDSGKILGAKKNGVYVLKLEGDVRLTICAALEIFLENCLGDWACGIEFTFQLAPAAGSRTGRCCFLRGG